MKQFKIKKVYDDAVLPKRATEYSSGYDLCSREEICLKSKAMALISTGLSIELEKGYEAQVRPRSGLAAKHGITVLNSPGTIDADYRGEIKVILINHSEDDFVITKGMRIAQMVFAGIIEVELIESHVINETARSSGGFGSTGYH